MDGDGCAVIGFRYGVCASLRGAAQQLPDGSASDSKSPPSSRSCWRLAATLSGVIAERAGVGIEERSWVPASVSRAPAVAAAEAGTFLEPSARAAATHAEPHGDLGTSDAWAETTSTSIVRPDAAASTGPPAHGGDCDSRFGRDAGRGTGAGHRI